MTSLECRTGPVTADKTTTFGRLFLLPYAQIDNSSLLFNGRYVSVALILSVDEHEHGKPWSCSETTQTGRGQMDAEVDVLRRSADITRHCFVTVEDAILTNQVVPSTELDGAM